MQHSYTTSNEAALAGINKSANIYDPDLEPLSWQDAEKMWRTARVNDYADSMREYMPGNKLDAYRESALNAINNPNGVSRQHRIPPSLGYDAYKMPTDYLSGLKDYIGAVNNFGRDMTRRFNDSRNAFNAEVQQHLAATDEANAAINRARNTHTPQMVSEKMNNYMHPFYNQVNDYIQSANSYNPNLHNYPYEGYRDAIWHSPPSDLNGLSEELGNGYSAFKNDFNNVYMPGARAMANSTFDLAQRFGDGYYGNQYNQLRSLDEKIIPAYENAVGNTLDLARTHIVPSVLQNAHNAANKISNELLPAYTNAFGRFANQYQQHWEDADVRGAANTLDALHNLYGTASGVVNDFRSNWNSNNHNNAIGEIVRDAKWLGSKFVRSQERMNDYADQVGQHSQDSKARIMQNLRNIGSDIVNSDQFNNIKNTAAGGAVGAAAQLAGAVNQTAQRAKQSPDYERFKQKAAPAVNAGKNLLNSFRNRGR